MISLFRAAVVTAVVAGSLAASAAAFLPLMPPAIAGEPAASGAVLLALADPEAGSLRLPRQSVKLPLHRAAIEDDVAAVVGLVGRGVSPDARDTEGRTPLMVAAAFGNHAVAVRLLALGADPLARDSHGEAALHFAARAGKPALVALLLAHGVDPDYPAMPRQTTALHYAATFGHARIIGQLVAAGAEIDSADVEGMRPLQYASRRNRTELVALMIGLGARPQTLHDAVNANDIGRAIELIRLGTDLDAPDLVGPPINLAAAKGYLAMVRILVDAGADIEASGDPSRSRPLHLAAMNDQGEVAGFLIGRGAAVDALDSWGRTPLMVAATFGALDVARRLLDGGADPERQDLIYRDSAIHFAAMAGHTEIVALLLSRGVPVDLPSGHDGESPLHYAAWHRNLDLVQYLVGQGADIHRPDRNGTTPLAYALTKGKAGEPTARYLMKVGATR
jgi:ankyrin repeat protein